MESAPVKCTAMKSSKRARTAEMVLPEVPPVKVVITSPNDYSTAVIGAEVTVVGTFIRTKVRTRTITGTIILTGASTQQKDRDRAADQEKLSACVHKYHSQLNWSPAWRR
jgi:hypothetical protein